VVDVRLGLAVVLAILVVAGTAVGWSTRSDGPPDRPLAVPTFADRTVDEGDARAAARVTLLPADCAGALTGPVDAAALLGQPTGSVAARTVGGVPAPSVGQLERLTCFYQRGPMTLITLGLGAFADAGSADDQRLRNIAAERSETRAARPVSLGQAKALLLTETDATRLMVAYDRYTITAALPPGVVADGQDGPVLVDLVRRVLPALTPPAAAVAAPVPARH
jgi:hypothetical protein